MFFTFALLFTAALFVFHPAFCEEEEIHPSNVTLFTNTRESGVPSDTPFPYLFTPVKSGLYRFYAFSGDVPVTMQLFLPEEDTPLLSASGQGTLFLESELSKGVTCILYLTCPKEQAEKVSIEVMPQKYGYCIDQPIPLSAAPVSYTRTLTSARDTHFYRFVAPTTGYYTIRSEAPGPIQLDTQCHLLNSQGVTLALDDDILFPGDANFRIFTRLTAGETYYIRVNAFSNNTGAYRLVISAPLSDTFLPRHLTLHAPSSVLDAGQQTALHPLIQPAASLPDIAYASSDPAVCTVSSDGVVTAIGAGSAQIFAFCGPVSASVDIHVRTIQAITLTAEEPIITLHQGESHVLRALFTPSNATIQSLSWASSDPGTVSVNDQGVITALAPGSAAITASSGSLSAQFSITVEPPLPVYRALVMGEETYLDGRVREGTRNTTLGVTDLLTMQSLGGTGYQVSTQINSTMQDFLDGLIIAFEGATENDISLLYINCHGSSQGDRAYLELHDGTRIPPDTLRRLLEGIPGRVVVILDCCQSGAFIGRSDGLTAFDALSRGRLLVITSSAANQDSYRLRFTGEGGEDGTATVLARSLAEGAGWDLIRDKKTQLKADSNRDGQITFSEIYQYARRRVHYYLSGTGVSQDVQTTNPGSQLILFASD